MSDLEYSGVYPHKFPAPQFDTHKFDYLHYEEFYEDDEFIFSERCTCKACIYRRFVVNQENTVYFYTGDVCKGLELIERMDYAKDIGILIYKKFVDRYEFILGRKDN